MVKLIEQINSKEYDFDKNKKICIYIIIFLIGSIIGFIYEEIFCYIFDNELVKRGFLYGTYLPVYGFGSIAIVYFLKKYKKNPLIIFISALLITGIVEYITGYLLFQIYHKTWWDYTGLFLNINGYVCLRSVLTFAIGGLLLIYIIEPVICKISEQVNQKKYQIISTLIVSVFVIDLILTLIFRNKL